MYSIYMLRVRDYYFPLSFLKESKVVSIGSTERMEGSIKKELREQWGDTEEAKESKRKQVILCC